MLFLVSSANEPKPIDAEVEMLLRDDAETLENSEEEDDTNIFDVIRDR